MKLLSICTSQSIVLPSNLEKLHRGATEKSVRRRYKRDFGEEREERAGGGFANARGEGVALRERRKERANGFLKLSGQIKNKSNSIRKPCQLSQFKSDEILR